MQQLTAGLVRELLDYNPKTGVFTWRPRDRKWFNDLRSFKAWNARFSGVQTGNVDSKKDYRFVTLSILGRKYYAHRIAWLYVTGELPEVVDHINHNGTDNRFENLRNVNQVVNGRNQKKFKTNTSGLTGVRWRDDRGSWVAFIKVCGIQKHLGYFEKFEDAKITRLAAESSHGFHVNHGVQV